MTRRCANTFDLLGWEPPKLALEADPAQVRAETLRDRVARTVSLVLRECGMSRGDVAAAMSAWLDEDVTENMLSAYASQAREDHTISAHRLAALAHVTSDMRALQVLVAPLGQAVIPERFIPAIEDALLDDKINELTQRRQMARRQWKGARG